MQYEKEPDRYARLYDISCRTDEIIVEQLRSANWGGAPEEVLRTLSDQFFVDVADTPEAIEEAHRLRYQVYCLERGYESSDTGLEVDEFDAQSRHIVLRHQLTGRAVGMVRLVLFRPGAGNYALPIQQFCSSDMLDHVPLDTTGEISRFVVPKDLRGLGGVAVTPIHVGLMRGVLQVSRELGLTHWCALMERSLLRLLRAAAIQFHPIGLPVAHHGLRQPAFGMIGQIISRVRNEKPAIWSFVDPQDQLPDPFVAS